MKVNSQALQFNLFLVLVFWLPIPLGSNRPWAWAVLELGAFCLLSVSLLSFSWPKIKERLRPYQGYVYIVAAFTLWQGLQSVPLPTFLISWISPNNVLLQQQIHSGQWLNSHWLPLSLDPVQTLVMFVKSCAYLAMACLVFIHVTNLRKLKLLVMVIIATGLFQATYGTLALLNSDDRSWMLTLQNSSNATGSFIYRNHFANFLILCASLAVGWLLSYLLQQRARSNVPFIKTFLSSYISGKFTLRLSLVCMVIAIVLSHSRMGNTAFFMALTLTLGLSAIVFGKTSRSSRRYVLVLLFSVLTIDALILGSWFGIDKVKQRIENTSLEKETRDNVAIDSMVLIKEFAMTGVGAGGFYVAYPRVKKQDVKGFYDHAHNDYLQFVIEYGLPMSILLMALIVVSIWHAYQAMLLRNSHFIRGLSGGCIMAVIGMMLHISVDFNLQSPANSAYFVIILALCWVCRFGLPSTKVAVPDTPKKTSLSV
ncbi:O-antigen ligase family protein [Thalassotalea litorea]|uniref:O-antigen ligase family protein n=1 Tax=Thalassotalea litorea TaxID=2020715 RepID=A0A5R9INR9_9GAMM|nr:O-antigen ligase family protein [Thalassotalea litorea]TLU64876.1 O-antigen ligase family protein [Thalassotalea litorea]